MLKEVTMLKDKSENDKERELAIRQMALEMSIQNNTGWSPDAQIKAAKEYEQYLRGEQND